MFDNRPKNQDKLMFSHLCFASVLTRRNCLQSTFLTKPFLCNCIKLLLIPNFCSNLISKPDDLIQLLTCVKCKLVCSLPILLLLEMHSPAFHSRNRQMLLILSMVIAGIVNLSFVQYDYYTHSFHFCFPLLSHLFCLPQVACSPLIVYIDAISPILSRRDEIRITGLPTAHL